MIHVRTKFERPDPDVVGRLGTFSSATIHEAQGGKGALSHKLKPLDVTMEFCGPAVTVQASPGDNLMVQVGISYAEPGDVLIVSAGEVEQAGSFGDVLATAAQAKGLVAFVTDSGVRDSSDIRAMGFPVFAGSVCIEGTVKETLGPMNSPLVVGGQVVHPGDILKGDADGIVVVRPREAEEVISLCRQREENEEGLRARHRDQEGSVIELHGLVEKLKAKGLVVED